MKFLPSLFLFAFVLLTASAFAQSTEKTDTVKVYGECGMCKSRIEKNLKVDGITAAAWSDETHLLTVTYDPAKITNEDIQKKLAAVGHDTEKFRATDEAYAKLPGCCKYERKKAQKQ